MFRFYVKLNLYILSKIITILLRFDNVNFRAISCSSLPFDRIWTLKVVHRRLSCYDAFIWMQAFVVDVRLIR